MAHLTSVLGHVLVPSTIHVQEDFIGRRQAREAFDVLVWRELCSVKQAGECGQKDVVAI